MKVKLFTHTDLDGVGCAIVGKHAFTEVDVEYCNYNDIDIIVEKFTATEQFNHFDKVYITDISVNQKVAELIDYSECRIIGRPGKFQLIDHHPTAKWLNKYEWAIVDEYEISPYPKEDKMKSSGTSLFYDHLWQHDILNVPPLVDFVELVRRYDTWEWTTRTNGLQAKQLNDLLFIIGQERFVQRFVNEPYPSFTDSEMLLLEIEQQKIDKYIEKKSEQMFESNIDNYNVGVVFAEQYQSQLGNRLAKNNEHLDFIVMIDVANNAISYRGIHDNVNLGEFAKRYSGGGHPKAAGSRTNDNVKMTRWRDYIVNSQ